jgi:uncharacterized protein YutD
MSVFCVASAGPLPLDKIQFTTTEMKFKTKIEEICQRIADFCLFGCGEIFTEHVAATAVVAGCGSEYKK